MNKYNSIRKRHKRQATNLEGTQKASLDNTECSYPHPKKAAKLCQRARRKEKPKEKNMEYFSQGKKVNIITWTTPNRHTKQP
jgi:hypothetical protein